MVDKGLRHLSSYPGAKFRIKLSINVRSNEISFQDGSLVAFEPFILTLNFFRFGVSSFIFYKARSIESSRIVSWRLLKTLHTTDFVVYSLITLKYLHIFLNVEISTSSRRWVTKLVLSALFRMIKVFGDWVVSWRVVKVIGLISVWVGLVVRG